MGRGSRVIGNHHVTRNEHAAADLGNTILVIEHNLDVIKCADWIIDMGPEGGDGGGTVVAEGTPEQVAKAAGSHTAEHLGAKLRPVAVKMAARRKAVAAG